MNAANTTSDCGGQNGQGSSHSSPLPNPPANFQIGCSKVQVANISEDQEGRIKESAHHSLPLIVSTDGGNAQKEDVGKIPNSTPKPMTIPDSHNTSVESEFALRAEELLRKTNRKLDLLLKKMNSLQRRVAVIEKNMNFFEKYKRGRASARTESPVQQPENSINAMGVLDSMVLPFSPVSCLFELEKLEEKAKDMHFVNYVKMQVYRIVGKKVSEGEGVSYCWRIIDCFFTGFFLTQCTWSGRSSRKTETGDPDRKIRFKDFTYVINMFHVAANYANPLHSKEDTEAFFRRALKYTFIRFHRKHPQKTSTIPDGAAVIPNEEILPKMITVDSVESYEAMEFDPLEIKSEPES